jgi:large subunit ribosomal protein L4
MAAPKAKKLSGSGSVSLDAAVFGEEFHMPLVHETVRAELNARRRGTASTKTRGEIAMTTAKAWRQKGTGRARAGALSTPQRTGGGVAFGPKPRSFTVKVNRKARRRALRCALSLHASRDSLAVLDPGDFGEPSTKKAAQGLGKLAGDGSVLLVLSREGEEGALKSFRNLSGVTVLPADQVGVADVVGAARLVLSQSALDHLTRAATAERARESEEAAA